MLLGFALKQLLLLFQVDVPEFQLEDADWGTAAVDAGAKQSERHDAGNQDPSQHLWMLARAGLVPLPGQNPGRIGGHLRSHLAPNGHGAVSLSHVP